MKHECVKKEGEAVNLKKWVITDYYNPFSMIMNYGRLKLSAPIRREPSRRRRPITQPNIYKINTTQQHSLTAQ